MTRTLRLFLISGIAAAGLLAGHALSQTDPFSDAAPRLDAAKTREQIRAAEREGAEVRKRAEALEKRARAASEAVEKTAREAAALAARIQENEAEIAVQEGKVALVTAQRRELRERLATRQGPLARLTGALQRLSRRPTLLALLRPGSVRDAVYMRALFDTMLPEVEKRTVALRREIEEGRKLERQAQAAEANLRKAHQDMLAKRKELAALETRQRLASHEVGGNAARESRRALALAERANDLGDLVAAMDSRGRLRDELAALPGPLMRPADPNAPRVIDASQFVPPPEGLSSWSLPVMGRLVTGFGEDAPGEIRARGITLATRPNAQIVAPAAGRVAFAGPYRGHGRIVILEHDGDWISLVTGLARLDVEVGETLVASAPMGIAGARDPEVMVELRRGGEPVNPLQFIREL
ncbi:murein hydrolase activator EnvC family protein [Novosphingobium profundi]|uniref:murein hydrolase activator EnvC family protein n=1 Tax=Novosphingobium profundi TaxID=1774954 RepID=UPI001CFE00FE|nr:peptidoglycan DD-metalloendopeptidase family protein [Novosphingobium profundi]